MGVQFPRHDRDPAFIVRGGDGPAVVTLPDDAGEVLALLNQRAGEILASQGIVSATTPQLLNAVKLAEQDLGVTYSELRARQDGMVGERAGTVSVLGAPMEVDADSIEADRRIVAALKERGLEATQANYLRVAGELGVSA